MQEINVVSGMSLDDALRSVVLTAWDDLSSFKSPRAVRVEYEWNVNGLERAEIWLVSDGGYQDLVCDFRAGAPQEHSATWKCWTRIHSQLLTDSLRFVARYNRHFRPPHNGCEHGMVVVLPPSPTWQPQQPSVEHPSPDVTALAKRAHAA